MATRSFIATLQRDGSVNGVYCHHDGYPEGVGATLKEHYRSAKKVGSLLALGDLSTLGSDTGPGYTTAYHRDRGEPLDPNMTYGSVSEAINCARDDLGAEYVYIFNGDGWEVYST